MAVADTAGPIQVTWDEQRGQFRVSERADRYFVTVEEMKRVCRLSQEMQDVSQTLDDLLDVLGAWAREHADKIEGAFLTVRDTGLLFLTVMKGRRYDRDLEDDLTRLDIKVAQTEAYKNVPLSVLAVPKCGKDGYLSFVNPQFCLSYKGLHAD